MKKHPLKHTFGLCLLALFVLPGAGAAILEQAKRSPKQEKEMQQKAAVSDLKADIVYKKIGDLELTLDLLLPRKKTDKSGRVLFPNGTPVVFYFHGGGWRGGSRYISPNDARFFSDNGLALACVSYRFAKNNGLTIADCVTDCFDAARFIVKNAARYGLDSSVLLAYGHSAGGHLTLMMLMADPGEFIGDPALARENVSFAGGVASAPPSNFVDPEALENSGWTNSDENFIGAFGGSREEKRALAQKVSPYYWLKKDSPRTLIIHGDADPTVGITQSLWMEKKARELVCSHA
ncbi:MAG: alpha/beta hydrolase [Opitutaceae bacterium]|jgi:acetyl esterase/lipase|nr:alpha/beta hydrolase [Opitutaceae bacterium]